MNAEAAEAIKGDSNPRAVVEQHREALETVANSNLRIAPDCRELLDHYPEN